MSLHSIEDARKVLNEPFATGTRVTNCVAHSDRAFDKRPDDCKLCAVDIQNHLALAIRINEFLNDKMDRVKAILS